MIYLSCHGLMKERCHFYKINIHSSLKFTQIRTLKLMVKKLNKNLQY